MSCNDSDKIDEDDSTSEITVIQKSSKQFRKYRFFLNKIYFPSKRKIVSF